MRRYTRFVLFLLILLLLPGLTGCGMVAIEIERTPTPDLRATAALGDLQAENNLLATTVAGMATPVAQRLSTESDGETIRRMLLYSYRNWDRVWVDAQRVVFQENNQITTSRIQIWIDQPARRLRALWGSDPALVDSSVISDGVQVRRIDDRGAVNELSPLSSDVYEGYNPPLVVTDTVYPHPMTGALGTPLSDLLLPSGLAQRSGYFMPVKMGVLAGRDVLVADWFWPDNTRSAIYSIDVETGLILREQAFPKGGGERLISDTTVTSLAYNPEFPDALFDLNAAGPLQFAAVPSGEPLTLDATPTPSGETAAAGEVYFFVNDLANQTIDFVRLDAGCLVAGAACPAVEPLSSQPEVFSQPQPLSWTADGAHALWISADNGILYHYDRAGETWFELFKADEVYAAAWSPDGSRAAFTARSDGVKDVFLVTLADGAVKNLTAGRLDAPDTNLAYVAWSSAERVLAATHGPAGIHVESIDVNDASATEVSDLPIKGGLPPMPSPDGLYWAATSAGNAGSALLVGPPGGQSQVIANFALSTIWPVAWSPDSRWLAFSVYATQNGRDTADLYAVHPDGSGLQLVFRAARIGGFAWSPDSARLVVQADDGQGIDHLYAAGLDGTGFSLLQAEGLRMDTMWVAPSWRAAR